MNGQPEKTVEFVSHFDSYVYQTLTSIIGKKIVVQLTNNSVVQGELSKVLPDHIVVETNQFLLGVWGENT